MWLYIKVKAPIIFIKSLTFLLIASLRRVKTRDSVVRLEVELAVEKDIKFWRGVNCGYGSLCRGAGYLETC